HDAVHGDTRPLFPRTCVQRNHRTRKRQTLSIQRKLLLLSREKRTTHCRRKRESGESTELVLSRIGMDATSTESTYYQVEITPGRFLCDQGESHESSSGKSGGARNQHGAAR